MYYTYVNENECIEKTIEWDQVFLWKCVGGHFVYITLNFAFYCNITRNYL